MFLQDLLRVQVLQVICASIGSSGSTNNKILYLMQVNSKARPTDMEYFALLLDILASMSPSVTLILRLHILGKLIIANLWKL